MRLQWSRNTTIIVMAGIVLTSCSHIEHRDRSRIEEAQFVSIGGIDQWVTIRGEDRSKPILLFIHGGPADPQSALVETYAPYERDFVFVQWDQRGAGKTFGRNRDTVKELTLERMAQDGVELASYLCTHLHRKKVIVLGHSWGSTLATAMVQKQPSLFHAYVGTGQVSSWRAGADAQWRHLADAAEQAHDTDTLERMKAIGTPDPFNVNQYFSWRLIMNRKYLGAADTEWLKNLRSFAARFSAADLKDVNDGGSFSGPQLIPVMMKTDLSVSAASMPVPYFVIQGREDFYTPTGPAIEYFNKVQAPKKELIIIEGAGHFAMMTHAEEFRRALVRLTQDSH